MSNSLKTERLRLNGPAGVLETLVEIPPATGTPAFGVVCHPHPLYGGALTNKVVYMLARAFQELGAPTIRFNFRGVGESGGQYAEGRGETEDTLAAIAYGRERWPGAKLWLAGFSFGGAVAIRAASQAHPARLVTVAPAISRVDVSNVAPPEGPWLIVQGEADELVAPREISDWVETLHTRPEVRLLPGTDHFFHGKLNELRAAVLEFMAS